MKYMVDLEAFHGPLDLLLYLIDKNEVDIYDIPIAEITDQYIESLDESGKINLDQLGGFLVLASYLLSLKSRMLLPKHVFEDEEDIESDPREELVQRLIEYRKFKEVAKYLATIQIKDEQKVFFRNHVYNQEINEVLIADIKSLVRTYQNMLNKLSNQEISYDIPTGDISITDKMQELLELLYNEPVSLVFQDVFSRAKNKREALVYFLALLELIRLQKVTVIQKEITDLIIIKHIGD